VTIPNLKSPSKQSDNTENKNKGSETLVLILAGVVVCLILIIVIILFIPSPADSERQYQEINNEKEITNLSEINEAIKADNEKIINKKTIDTLDKVFNEDIKIDWMLKKSDAENNNMPVWAEKKYIIATTLAETAEQLILEKKYKLAEKNYKEAIDSIDKSLNEQEEILNELIEQAMLELENEQLLKAKELFIKAQAIEQHNKIILKGLYRIEHRDEVINLYRLAIENDENNDLESAIIHLNKALLIDPDYKKAKEKLVEVEQKKNQQDFNNAISQILEDLENNNLQEAQKGYKIARSLSPSDPVVNDIKIRIEKKIKSLAISKLQRKAANQERKEKWTAALTSFREILKYDPDTSSAIMSEQRIKLYIKLNKLLEQISSKPERLQNENVLKSSKKTLAYIDSELTQKQTILYPLVKTPILEKKINATKIVLKEASVEIPVTIKSDNETDIIIYKVKKFGKLIEKTILLRPGRYTIVGSRMDYRDYRKILQIKASDRKVIIDVRCREKI